MIIILCTNAFENNRQFMWISTTMELWMRTRASILRSIYSAHVLYRNLFHMIVFKQQKRAGMSGRNVKKPKKIHKIHKIQQNKTNVKKICWRWTQCGWIIMGARICRWHFSISQSLTRSLLSSFEILRFEMSFDFMCYLFCGLALGDKRWRDFICIWQSLFCFRFSGWKSDR